MTSIGRVFATFTYDLLFFSNDVQTTAIAVAVTGSLCCSIAYAIIHLVARLHYLVPPDLEENYNGMFKKENLTLTHIKYQIQKTFQNPSKSTSTFQFKKKIPYCSQCETVRSDGDICSDHCNVCCPQNSCDNHDLPCHKISTRPQHLDLSCKRFKEVPERLGFVGSQLKLLDLSDNNIKTLPVDIGLLVGLHSLYIHNNSLQSIPVSLGSLLCLSSLDLANNQINNIPESFWSLTGLRYLNLDKNHLTSLPSNISRLVNLQTLSFRSNKITEVPESIGCLFNLEVLNMCDNNITVLPDSISRLINLHDLKANNCGLTWLPGTIGACRSLQILQVHNNRLKELPYSIGQLDLEYLSISNNHLQCFPSNIEDVMSNTIVDYQNNELLTKDKVKDFLETINQPEDVSQMIPPSLVEITARCIFELNLKHTQILPNSLQAMLKTGVRCNGCRRQTFRYKIYDIKTTTRTDNIFIPFLLIYCSKYCQLTYNIP